MCDQSDCSEGGAQCILIHNQPQCICPSCLDELNPVSYIYTYICIYTVAIML